MNCPRAVIFDLDDTLAESFEAPGPETIRRLKAVLDIMPLAIITGRDFARAEPGFLPEMTKDSFAHRFFVLPESSTQCLEWDGSAWKERYGFSISESEREHIRKAMTEGVEETGVLKGLPCFGTQFVEKRAQTAFAALGLQVPRELKYTWDPGNVRRSALQKAFAQKLPEFEVLLGGATSIDVTKKGMNKSYGVLWLSKEFGIPVQEMLYVGDALQAGGNDAVVIPTGIQTRSVSGPAETEKVIDELLHACA